MSKRISISQERIKIQAYKRDLKRAPNKHELALLGQTLVTCSRGGKSLVLLKSTKHCLITSLNDPPKFLESCTWWMPWIWSSRIQFFDNLKRIYASYFLIGSFAFLNICSYVRYPPLFRKNRGVWLLPIKKYSCHLLLTRFRVCNNC